MIIVAPKLKIEMHKFVGLNQILFFFFFGFTKIKICIIYISIYYFGMLSGQLATIK